jgi:acetyltransferase-like isoleucine patch superfamily enzyme
MLKRDVLFRLREILQGRWECWLREQWRPTLMRCFYPMGQDVTLEAGVRLWGRGIVLGSRLMLDRHTTVLGPVSLGSGIYINQFCILSQGVTIEDNVLLGYNVVVFGDSRAMTNNPNQRGGPAVTHQTWIEKGAFIGARSTIMPGVRVGKGAIVAAGSVVTKDCEPNALYAGVPAKKIRDLQSEPPVDAAISESPMVASPLLFSGNAAFMEPPAVPMDARRAASRLN